MVQRIGVRVEYKVHRLAECKKRKEKRTKRDGTGCRMPGRGGGSTLSTVSWGGWTLALIGAVIGTNEPSIAPITLAKPANA